MYMNKFMIGAVIGSIVGAIGAWYMISSDKDKRAAAKYVKSFMS